MINASEVYQKIKPFIARDFKPTTVTQAVGSGGLPAHALSGPYHTGSLARSQAPWVATDISAAIASHAALPDVHHAKQHSITNSADHTVTGLAWDVVGLSATNTLAILNSSSNPGATEKLVRTASDGSINLTAVLSSSNGLGGAILQGVVDSDNSFARAFIGHNAQWDGSNWIIDAIGANDAGGIFIPNNSASLDFVFHPTTGNTPRTMNHATFIAGAKFRFGSNGRLAVNSTDTSTYTLYVNGTVSASGIIYAGNDIEITGDLLAANGSAGSPSISFLSDTDTGIYRTGTNAMGLVAGGAAIVNVGATGAAVNAAYDSTAALKVMSVANDDITLFMKQKSGQTARMWRVEDSAGQELIVLDSEGNLQSGNPGFVSGLTGWQITPIGNLEANNAWIRGELHASVFVMDEFHASGGTLYIAPAGKLENDATVYTTTAVQEVLDTRTTSGTFSGTQVQVRTTSGTFSGTTVTRRYIKNYFDISDPPSGHATILSIGDRIRCKALGESSGIDLFDAWGIVSRIEDMSSYYRYYYDRKSGGANGLVLPAGTAIISYGKPGAGRIYLTADQNYAPYMQVFLSGQEPWNGQITPTVRIGRLDGVGLPGVSGIEQYGMVLSSDLSNASAPFLVASNLQMFQYKIDSEWNNGNPTARITANGEFRLGTDVDSDATTGLKFNPTTGALDIGSASYSGAVTVYGSITVTGGSGYANFSDKPTSLAGINAGEGTKLSGIAANATVGATWGTNLNSIPTRFGDAPSAAGLYLTPTHLGYYDGSAWKAWFSSGGPFYFGGNSGAHLEWNGTKLRGIGTDGTTEQWYAQSTDGKFYAAAGAIGMDSTGFWLRMNASSSWATASAITFRSAANFNTIDAVLSTRTVTSSRYVNLLIDPDTYPVGLEIIASPAAQRVNVTHDLTVTRDLTVSGALYTADIDMGGNDLIDIGTLGGAWTGFSFGTGWASYGGAYATGAYKKAGDLVVLRGLVKRTSGSGITIATLPVGYRPSAYALRSVASDTGYAEIEVRTDGTVVLRSGGTTYLQLDGIVFSTI